MLNFIRLSAVALVALGISASAHAAKEKKPVDFSDFRGSYTGTCTFQANSGTTIYPGTGQITVAVPKNGRTARVTVNASVTTGGVTYPFRNTFSFHGSKSASEEDVLYNFGGAPAGGAVGSYTKTQRKVTFNLPFTVMGTAAVTTGTMSFHPAGKRKQVLNFTSSLDANGGHFYVFTFDVSKKVKPKK